MVQLVIGKSMIDAQSLNLSGLSSSVVMGETAVYLPERGNLTAKIEGVMGSITIYVPDSMEVRINSDVGLINVQLPDDYVTREGYYYSPDYAGAENKVDLEVSQVLGKVEVIKK
jgi:predicted membrane protein